MRNSRFTKWISKAAEADRREVATSSCRRRTSRLLERLEDRTLLNFSPIGEPSNVYLSSTTNLASSIPADNTSVTALSDSVETITFSSSVTAGTIPGPWGSWDSPPAVESSTPRELMAADFSSLTLDLSRSATTLGFEMEPYSAGPYSLSAAFYDHATLVGTVTRDVMGNGGATLFAASTTDQPFTRVVITAPLGANGFAIAQLRYCPSPQADLAIVKQVNTVQVNPGGTLTYTLNVTNKGPDSAQAVVVSDALPAGTTFSSVTTAAGWTEADPGIGNNGTVSFNTPSLASGQSASFTITVAVNSMATVETYVNDTATIASETEDPDPSNNSSTVSTLLVGPYVNISGTSLDDRFVIQKDADGYVDFYVNGNLVVQRRPESIVAAMIYGSDGNDRLTVDSSNGLIQFTGVDPANPFAGHYIGFDGGTGFNSLVLTEQGSSGLKGADGSETITVGQLPGTGSDVVSAGGVTQTVHFLNLTPIYTDLAQPTIQISPGIGASILNGSNQIQYTPGHAPGDPTVTDPTWGQVTIDGWEPINFTNKANLTIDTGPGQDTVSVSNPNVPAGMTTDVAINGGDPNAGDTLIFAVAELGTLIQGSSQGAGRIFSDPAPNGLNVSYTGIGTIQVDGSRVNKAYLGIEGTTGNDSVSFTPGQTTSNGTVTGTMDLNGATGNGPFTLPEICYSGFDADPEDVFIPISYDMYEVSGGSDTVTFNATPGASVAVRVMSPEKIAEYVGSVLHSALSVSPTISLLNVRLSSGGGANSVTVGSGGTATAYAVDVTATDPSSSSLTYAAPSGSSTEVDVSQRVIRSPGMGDVTYSGIGSVTLNALGGSLSFENSIGATSLAFTPTAADAGRLTAGQGDPTFFLQGVTTASGGLRLDPGAGGSVTVNGNSAVNAITAVIQGGGELRLPVVQVDSLLAAALNAADSSSVTINGLEGNDTLTVDSTLGAFPIPIVYDGGAGRNGLVLQGGTATADSYAPGPGVGMGASSLTIGQTTEKVTFVNLAPVLDIVAGPLTVLGTPSNDTINYSAAATPGDGLVTVNNFESIEFLNKTSLTLDGQAGDDTITVNNTGTPVGLAALNVLGGIGNDTLVVDANNLPVLSSDITAASVNVPGATPVSVTYGTIEAVRVIHSQVAYVTSPLTVLGKEGTALVNVPVASFNFTDPASPTVLGRIGDFAATIDWGDGTTSAGTIVGLGGGGFQVQGSHVYAAARSYSVATTIVDLGSQRSFTPADGVPVTIQDLAGTTIVASPEVGNVTVGTELLLGTGVPVLGVEGLAVGALPPTPPPADVLVATFLDMGTPGPIGEYTALIEWGDGSSTAATRITQIGSLYGVLYRVYGTHTYAEVGTYPVTVTITKTEGIVPETVISVTEAASAATIADAPLSASKTQPTVATTEAALYPVPQFAPPAFSGQVASFVDLNPGATLDDFTATIDWGDGTTPTSAVVSQPGGIGTAFLVSGSHTYADAGPTGQYAIQVFVQDADGARLTVNNTAAVADRPITVAGILNPLSDSGKSSSDAITNVNQPNFYGTSEPFSHVVLYANGNYVGQVQAGSDGAWSITSNLLADGHYRITAAATDQFGQTTSPFATITPDLLIDTVGPRVVYAGFDRMTATVYYTFEDFLANGNTPGGSGLLVQSLSDSANYSLNRVHTKPLGTYIVTSLSASPDSTSAFAYDVSAVFNRGVTLKGGYFQIIARSRSAVLPSGIQDVAGNALDGEFYGQSSASGNGVPGGDFVANIKSIHQNTPGHGYSGPVTIIGYPHPNDPPYRATRITRTVTRVTGAQKARTSANVAAPRSKASSIVALTGSSATTRSKVLLTLRQRMMQDAAAAHGLA